MSVLLRPGPRFLLWVIVLVAVATAAGLAHFSWWLIAVLEFAAWALVAAVERSLSRPRAAGFVAAPIAVPPALEVEPTSYVRVLERPAEPAPVQAEPEPQPEPAPAPAPAPEPLRPVVSEAPRVEHKPDRKGSLISRPFRPAAARSEPDLPRIGRGTGSERVQWNIWNLERIVREQAADNEELSFLVTHLRDYANPEGLLPPEFDPLVRESFGNLLSSIAV